MRAAKRVLLSLAEVGLLIAGFFLSLALGVLFGTIREDLAWAAFWFGLIGTFIGFLILVRKNAVRRMAHDAAAYVVEKAERRTHPLRARWRRIAKRVAVWVPSAMAAFVFLYFPQATHIVHPRAGHLKHYVVPIPWKFTLLSYANEILIFGTDGKEGRFGMTRYWIAGPMSSQMNFWSIDPDKDAFSYRLEYVSRSRVLPGVVVRDFTIGDVAVTCWELPFRYHYEDPKAYWTIDCRTPSEERERNFYAEFRGRRVDVAGFYEILRGVRPR